MSSITLCILTKNRHKQLVRTASKVLSIIKPLEKASILVVDNSSPDIQNLNKDFAQANTIKYISNDTDLGIGGSFFKCFYLCHSHYLWCMSDDDSPDENLLQLTIQTLLNHSESQPPLACIFIPFFQEYSEKPFLTGPHTDEKTVVDLCFRKNKIPGVLLQSIVFNIPISKSVISDGYDATNVFPHVSLLALMTGKKLYCTELITKPVFTYSNKSQIGFSILEMHMSLLSIYKRVCTSSSLPLITRLSLLLTPYSIYKANLNLSLMNKKHFATSRSHTYIHTIKKSYVIVDGLFSVMLYQALLLAKTLFLKKK